MEEKKKNKGLFDFKDTILLGDGSRCCPSHYLPHAMPLFGKPVTDEQCHTHISILHKLHHNFFCKKLKCPNYPFMIEETEKIMDEKIRNKKASHSN